MSLTSVCHLKHRKSKPNFCLKSLCSGSAALPPLNSITDPDHSKPNNSAVAALPTQQRSPHESNNTLVTPAADPAKDESDNTPVGPAAEPAKDESDNTQVAPEAESAKDLPIQQRNPTTPASISSATIRTHSRTSPVIIAFFAWFKFYNCM